MHGRQRVLVVALLLIALCSQGVRLFTEKRGNTSLQNQVETIVYAQSTQNVEERHCPLVHVNTSGLAELQTLPGIGPVYAERIMIQRREAPFRELGDLLSVSGIGPKRLEQLNGLVCFYDPDQE